MSPLRTTPHDVRADWAWGYNAKTRQAAFRALEGGVPIIVAEGPVVDHPETLRVWVYALLDFFRAHDLMATGFPETELIESARATYAQYGLSWGDPS